MIDKKQETNKILINTGDRKFEFILKYPEFKHYQQANIALQDPNGTDILAAGRYVIKHCWLDGGEIIEGKEGYNNSEGLLFGDESKDNVILKAFISACSEAYLLLNIFESELKKN